MVHRSRLGYNVTPKNLNLFGRIRPFKVRAESRNYANVLIAPRSLAALASTPLPELRGILRWRFPIYYGCSSGGVFFTLSETFCLALIDDMM